MKKQQNQTKLSIIILNHNTSELLKQCLSSIPSDNETQIIVVDNASTDDSVEMVKKNFSKVELILNPENNGYTRGNNMARKAVKGDYVLFLNSDTKMFSDTLPEILKLMDSDERIGISTPFIKLVNGKPYYGSHRGFPTPWNSLCYFSGLAKLFPQSKLFAGYTATYLSLTTTHEIDACSGTFLLIRKNLLDQIGWFDEDYFSYGEDLEMCFRIKELGYKIMFDPDAELIHYWGASSGLTKSTEKLSQSDQATKEKWSQARYEAMKIFYDKHYCKQYPKIVRALIFFGIDLMSKYRRYSN